MVYHIAGGKQTHKQHFTHWFKEMDGDPQRVQLEDPTPDNGAPVAELWSAGRAIRPENMPTRLLRGGPGPAQSPVLDVEAFYGGALLVRQPFKDLLERLEPGVHRFFPMEVHVKAHDPTTWQPEDGFYDEPEGKEIPLVKLADYWLVNICNRLDSYHPLTIGRTERGFYNPRKLGVEGREVFSLDRIGRCHAWHDKFAFGRYISDSFADLLRGAGLTGIVLKHFDQA
jgi:hypothetical protein